MESKFVGTVGFRSSKSASGPPGEKAILELNPQRRAKILEATGWPSLEPGSLNLTVANDVLEQLLTHAPLLTEAGDTVIYPERFRHIPIKRKAYYYFGAEACANGKSEVVLVRRAEVPVPGRVELFAARSLKSFFGLKEGERVEVVLNGPSG